MTSLADVSDVSTKRPLPDLGALQLEFFRRVDFSAYIIFTSTPIK